MTYYRIVCTEQEPVGNPHHGHIVSVGTGEQSDKATQRWLLVEILSAMDRGDVFYTRGIVSGKMAIVEKYYCSSCSRTHIRSTRDATPENNLDNLRICRWQ